MIPVFIPATPLRPDYRPLLIERLGGLDVVEVLVDENMTGAWLNLRRCILAGIERCRRDGLPAFVTVHEDVYPVDDFQRHVTNAVASQPGKFFCGFLRRYGRSQVTPQHEAQQFGYDWCYFWRNTSQCFVWPVDFASEFIAWIDVADKDPGFWPDYNFKMRNSDKDDYRVLCYLSHLQGLPFNTEYRLRILCSVPCLVEHLGVESTCPDLETGRFQTWQFKAQLFDTVLHRVQWGSAVYLPHKAYGSRQ